MSALTATAPSIVQTNSAPYPIVTPRNSSYKNFFVRVATSPTFWTLAHAAALSSYAVVVLTGTVAINSLVLSIAAVRLCILFAQVYYFRAALFYEITLNIGRIKNAISPTRFPWWNKIDERITLGAIPIVEKRHHETIPHVANAVVSIVEDFELQDRWILTTPVSPSMWRERNIEQIQIPANDIRGITPEQADRAVEAIHRLMLQNRHVYIHCKAGVGRSATVVACYLLKYGLPSSGRRFSTPEEAIAYVLEKRPQVYIGNSRHKRTISEYFNRFCRVA